MVATIRVVRSKAPTSLVEEADDKLIHGDVVPSFILDAQGPLAVAVGAVGVGEHVGRNRQMDAILIVVTLALVPGIHRRVGGVAGLLILFVVGKNVEFIAVLRR